MMLNLDYWSFLSYAMSRFETKRYRNVPQYARKKAQGRNEPCACGSGKKYKLCCGKDEMEDET